MNRRITLIEGYICPIMLPRLEPKNEDTVTHVVWDKV